MKTLKNFNFSEKRVLVRCDFNVPLGDNNQISDDFRIKKTLPTIEYLIKERARVILMSHLGDPKGKMAENLRLKPVKERLNKYLKKDVSMASDCVGEAVEKMVAKMDEGDILLLENLRFNPGEESNDEEFAKNLAKLADIYINDAFGTCHRQHASMVGVPKFLASGVGLLLEKEIKVLSDFMKKPKKPVVAIIGGKKVETKSALIDRISEIADFILIGGLLEKEIKTENIKLKYPEKILGPIDETGGGKDIGSGTRSLFGEKIKKAKTVFWNGPLGLTEEEQFQAGTKAVAQAIIESRAFSIVGGGETVDFLNQLGLADKFSHVSTGGGAMLSFLSGETLPALEILK